ncbi:hypothetical protein LTR95_019178, partial [Oleoguttula sp. CCFEE 5521]
PSYRPGKTMEVTADQRSITRLATDCRRLLRYSRDGPGSELVEWAEIEAARMRVWAAMLGVFAEGDMSVDYRLRKNPEVREMLTELLDALRADLRQCKRHSSVSLESTLLMAFSVLYAGYTRTSYGPTTY